MNFKQTASSIFYFFINPKQCLKLIYKKQRTIDYEKYISEKFSNINRLPTVDIRFFLNDNINTIEPYCFLEGGSTLPDLLLLKNIAASISDCNYFEIGTWRGESISNVALHAKKCISLSLSIDEQKSYGFSKSFIDNHILFSKNLINVQHIGHNSLTYDFTPHHKQFDLVFIDGLHTYEAVKSDTINSLKLLRDENSIIVWHDYGISPEKINWDIFAAILDVLPPEDHKYLYHVSNSLCAIYTRKKYTSELINFPAFPEKIFTVTMDIKPI